MTNVKDNPSDSNCFIRPEIEELFRYTVKEINDVIENYGKPGKLPVPYKIIKTI